MTAARSPIAGRATAADPCPVCGTPSKGCSTTADEMHLCRGLPVDPAAWVDVLKGREDAAGFRHYRRKGDRPTARSGSKPAPGKRAPGRRLKLATAATDWIAEAEQFASRLTPEWRAKVAGSLGLPAAALAALPLLGLNGATSAGPVSTWPECNSTGTVVGITQRIPGVGTTEKKMLPGGRRGLTLPVGWRDRPGPVFVCEGASDTLALTAAGLAAVGTAAAGALADELARLLGTVASDRRVIVVGDRDPHGKGQQAAAKLAADLTRKLTRPADLAVLFTLPPGESKDIRAWLTAPERVGMSWADRGDVLCSALVEAATIPTAQPAAAGGAGGDEGDEPRPVVQALLDLAESEATFWHDGGTGYVSVGRRSMPVRDEVFALWLMHRFRRETGRVPGGDAVATAAKALDAAARFDGPRHTAHVRSAFHGGRAFLHLSDDSDTVVEVGADGWRECPDPPVKFRRTAAALPLPRPERGGSLTPLRKLLNVGDDQFALLLAAVTAYVCPSGPVPVMVVSGEQGSAKTSLAWTVKALVDPSVLPTRSEPKEPRDLFVAAHNTWCLAFDNLSHLPPWLSDGFCVLATGGGFAARRLYTGGDEGVFAARRPVITTGIEDLATRGDLLSRSVVLRLPAIPAGRRMTESGFRAAVEELRPSVLGALLDRVAAGLRALPAVRLDELPRMADFARWAVACERGAGEPARFMAAFAENEAAAAEQALDASPVAGAVADLMAHRFEWAGTASELLRDLAQFAPHPLPRAWPRAANALTGRLRRLAPDLLRVNGIAVGDGRACGGTRTRTVKLTRRSGDETGTRPADDL